MPWRGWAGAGGAGRSGSGGVAQDPRHLVGALHGGEVAGAGRGDALNVCQRVGHAVALGGLGPVVLAVDEGDGCRHARITLAGPVDSLEAAEDGSGHLVVALAAAASGQLSEEVLRQLA